MECEHKGMMSALSLVAAPISARNYSLKRTDLKDIFNTAVIYVFCRRSLLKFDGVVEKSKCEICFDIVNDDGSKRVFTELYLDEACSEFVFNSHSLDSEEKHELFIKREDGHSVSLSPEDILWGKGLNGVNVDIRGDVKELLSFEVLYVGETVDQGVGDRLGSHHALLKIFMNEEIVKNYDKSHEIFILAFKNNNFDAETYACYPDKPIKPTGTKVSALDIEQAFINLFDGKYNEIKYKDFPDGNDLLEKGSYNTIIYAINENIILNSNNIHFVGDAGELFSDKNAYSFLMIKKRNMIVYYPHRNMQATIKSDGKFVPYVETRMK